MHLVRWRNICSMVVHLHLITPERLLLHQFVVCVDATILALWEVGDGHLLLDMPSPLDKGLQIKALHRTEVGRRASWWAVERARSCTTEKAEALEADGVARHAFGSWPAPKDGFMDDSTIAKSLATGLQPSAEPHYIIRKL